MLNKLKIKGVLKMKKKLKIIKCLNDYWWYVERVGEMIYGHHLPIKVKAHV